MFGVTTGLANSRDERLLGGVLAQSVALEVLGHAEKRRATSEAIAGVSQLGLPGAITAMTASLLVSQNYSSSQLEDATKRATEILTNVGDPDPAGTLQYALAQLQAVGVVEPWPAGERPDFLQEKVNKAVVPLVTGAERPTYTLGQKWIRNDGEYTLTKIGPDAYVFSVGPDQEIHLTKDLMVGRAQQGGWVTEFESLPQVWPPVVGKWGSGYGRCKIPSEPTMASVRYEWSIDAYEEIQVPAGSFKAFRIVMAWEPTETRAGFGRKRLVSWYAPGVRQLLKAEFTDAGPLNFQVVSVDQQATVAPR
jgi:hypothetical protein